MDLSHPWRGICLNPAICSGRGSLSPLEAMLQGPASKDWNDGYVQTPYFSGHGGGLHYDVNSTSQQNLSVQSPPTIQVRS